MEAVFRPIPSEHLFADGARQPNICCAAQLAKQVDTDTFAAVFIKRQAQDMNEIWSKRLFFESTGALGDVGKNPTTSPIVHQRATPDKMNPRQPPFCLG